MRVLVFIVAQVAAVEVLSNIDYINRVCWNIFDQRIPHGVRSLYPMIQYSTSMKSGGMIYQTIQVDKTMNVEPEFHGLLMTLEAFDMGDYIDPVLSRVRRELEILLDFKSRDDDRFVKMPFNCFVNQDRIQQNWEVLLLREPFDLEFPYHEGFKDPKELIQFRWEYTDGARLRGYRNLAFQLNELYKMGYVYNTLDTHNVFMVHNGRQDYLLKLYGFTSVTKEGEVVESFSEQFCDIRMFHEQKGAKANDVFSLGLVIAHMEIEFPNLYRNIDQNKGLSRWVVDTLFETKMQKIQNIRSSFPDKFVIKATLYNPELSLRQLLLYMTERRRSCRLTNYEVIIRYMDCLIYSLNDDNFGVNVDHEIMSFFSFFKQEYVRPAKCDSSVVTDSREL